MYGSVEKPAQISFLAFSQVHHHHHLPCTLLRTTLYKPNLPHLQLFPAINKDKNKKKRRKGLVWSVRGVNVGRKGWIEAGFMS
ncbi:hypothetical protein VTN00DRAFT_2362 [Thermoascus crustaceus]|uniref:uncharacterized protein n=1 Tax=Thermoascus crustaceus TaxID=5088 RepID=UPI0037421156